MKWFSMLFLVFVTLAFAPAVPAQPGDGMGMRGQRDGGMQGDCPRPDQRMGKMMDRMAERIGLSEEQKKQANAMHKKLGEDMQALRNEKQEISKALMELDPESKTYANESKRLAKMTGSVAERMAMLHAKHRTEFYGILTPEQKTKLKAWHEEQQKMRKERPGNRQQM